MVEGQHLEQQWYDDAEGCPADQDLVERKPEVARDLQVDAKVATR